MRKRIYEILEVGEDDDIASRAYDLFYDTRMPMRRETVKDHRCGFICPENRL